MARIRCIKPELPHSESMGRVSRDARLTFIELWTLADDAGRLRGNSRMLASLLFPYDDDAPTLIDTWLDELEREKCIQRYQVDGASYIQVCNWLTHQKIDRPTPSKLPSFDDASRVVANPREDSSGDLDQGSGSGRERKGEERAREFDANQVTCAVKGEYPKGTYGGQNWILAERAIAKLLDEGEAPEALATSARLYADQQRAKGSIGTQFIRSPEKFFGEGFWRGPFPLPTTKAQAAQDANIAASHEWLARSSNG